MKRSRTSTARFFRLGAAFALAGGAALFLRAAEPGDTPRVPELPAPATAPAENLPAPPPPDAPVIIPLDPASVPATAATPEAPPPPPPSPPESYVPEKPPSNEVVVVVGPPGEEAFLPGFIAAAKAWVEACRQAGASCTVIGFAPSGEGRPADRELLQKWLAEHTAESTVPVWIVFLGHGTWDGREARMNLRGPDVTPAELSAWLRPVRRPLVLVNGASASGPFVAAVSGPGRVVVTGTQNGNEINYARFGERFAEAVGSPAADIDQDGQTSVLEAFVYAAQQTQAFYKENGRMASEHALIDDNGDKRGTPFDWYRGTRVVRRAQGGAAADGSQARLIALAPNALDRALTPDQMALRATLEKEIEVLRERKADLDEAEYYAELEALLRQLTPFYVVEPAATTLPAPPAEASSASAASAPALPPAASPPLR